MYISTQETNKTIFVQINKNLVLFKKVTNSRTFPLSCFSLFMLQLIHAMISAQQNEV